jgi:hypothetical protein
MAERPEPITKKILISSARGGASSVEPTITAADPIITAMPRMIQRPFGCSLFVIASPSAHLQLLGPDFSQDHLQPCRPRMNSSFGAAHPDTDRSYAEARERQPPQLIIVGVCGREAKFAGSDIDRAVSRAPSFKTLSMSWCIDHSPAALPSQGT